MRLVFSGLVAAALAIASAASASSINVTNASAAGDLGAPGNSTVSGVFAESFTARSLNWSGNLTSDPNFFFFEEDTFASVQGPNGLGYTGPIAGQQGIFLGTTPFAGWARQNPAMLNGAWTFEAFTPNTLPNSTDWSIADAQFTFSEDLFPAASPLGAGDNLTAVIEEGDIAWYEINHTGGALRISTAGSLLAELDGSNKTNDTIIALYDAAGDLVASDDNSGPDLTSLLDFADLAAGDYRLAATGATLGTRVGDGLISTSHDAEGTIVLSVTVPEPCSIVIAAVCLAFGCAQRTGQKRRD